MGEANRHQADGESMPATVEAGSRATSHAARPAAVCAKPTAVWPGTGYQDIRRFFYATSWHVEEA